MTLLFSFVLFGVVCAGKVVGAAAPDAGGLIPPIIADIADGICGAGGCVGS